LLRIINRVKYPAMSVSSHQQTWLSSNPNIILGCTIPALMARIEDPARLD
jgi:hypothetical protein